MCMYLRNDNILNYKGILHSNLKMNTISEFTILIVNLMLSGRAIIPLRRIVVHNFMVLISFIMMVFFTFSRLVNPYFRLMLQYTNDCKLILLSFNPQQNPGINGNDCCWFVLHDEYFYIKLKQYKGDGVQVTKFSIPSEIRLIEERFLMTTKSLI